MNIKYDFYEDVLTYARISSIVVDKDFKKEMIIDDGTKEIISGRILLTVKLYTNESSYLKYGRHKHIIEDMPIEGDNFNFCMQEINNLENILNAIIEKTLNK